MKPFLIIFLYGYFILPSVQAQRWESYIISVKGDTINSVDKAKKKQGKWVVRVESLRGEPGYEEEGEFIDDLKEGYWRRYNLTGDILAIEFYKWGYRDGKQLYFSAMGDLIREEGWKAVNPQNPYDTIEVTDRNNPMVSVLKVVKHEASELRHGPWKYYNPSSGLIVKTENFSYGQRLDDLGRPLLNNKVSISPSTSESSGKPKNPPKPAAVLEWEKKNSGKKKVDVRDGRTGG
ncbi:MAG: hypothetical protein ACK4V4_06210 [Sphingobacteriales bacterium]|jgi:hypothetical protein